MIRGDLNITRFSSEKRGGCPISADMRPFSNWIRQHELIDLPLVGARYIWTNYQEDPIISRLDRFLISFQRSTFDHYSISRHWIRRLGSSFSARYYVA